MGEYRQLFLFSKAYRCWKLEFRDSFISLRVTAKVVAMTTRCKPWVEDKKRRGWGVCVGGVGVCRIKKKIKKEKTNFLSEQIYVNSLLSCEVNSCRSLALPPRSKQRDGGGSVSANTTSDGLKRGSAKHRVCGMKEKKKRKDFNQIKGGIQICAWARPHRRCLWADGWGRLNTLKIH